MNSLCIYSFEFAHNKPSKKTGKGNVSLRVFQGLETSYQKYFSTGVSILPKYWNAKKKEITKHPDSIHLNNIINSLKRKLETYELDTISKGKSFHINMFKSFLAGETIETFTDFCIRTNERQKKTKNIKTANNYRFSLDKLFLYKKIILFNEIDYKFIKGFDNWLLTIQYKKGSFYNQNTIKKTHKHINMFVKEALSQGYINRNPYDNITIKTVPSERVFITEAEFKAIENSVFPEELKRLNKVRDYFLFMCYTGLRISDFLRLKKSHIKQNEKEQFYIEIKPKKTQNWRGIGKPIHIPLRFNGKPIDLINKYQSEEIEFVFIGLKDQEINSGLKEVAKFCKIDKNLCNHVARRTFATRAYEHNILLAKISKVLGHSSITTTMKYIGLDTQSIDTEMDKLNF